MKPSQFVCLTLGFVLISLLGGCVKADSVPALFRDCVSGEIPQKLVFDDLHQERFGLPYTPFVTVGRRLYIIGDIDGGFRPRQNPYERTEDEFACHPTAGELGGVWAQPVKALDGYVYVLKVGDEIWPLIDAAQFTQRLSHVEFTFRHGDLTAVRRDFVPEDDPALFTSLSIRNNGDEPVPLQLSLFSYFDLEEAWMSQLGSRPNMDEHVEYVDSRILARAVSTDDWAVILGGIQPPISGQVIKTTAGQRVGQLNYETTLAPDSSETWTFLLVVEVTAGVEGVLASFDDLITKQDELLAIKDSAYREVVSNAPLFHSPDPTFDDAFRLAKANSLMLMADTPALSQIMYAGLEAFPYWFSNDLAYSVGGLLIAGFDRTVANQLRIAARYGEEAEIKGHIPHQISPGGTVIGPGNVQETPQFVSAAWDYYRWTGDVNLLSEIYPTAVRGLFDFNLGSADQNGNYYPEGPAMVERKGMGSEKLDATCYLWEALGDLARIAEVLGDVERADHSRIVADAIQSKFHADWWLPDEQVYADSIVSSDQLHFEGHWTVAVPLEVGLAPMENGLASLARIKSEYLNEWGLLHTRGADNRVWTLPTGVLSRGAYRYGDAELGLEMLRHLAQTLDHDSIGMFHELIPEGLSFLQLWSGATFMSGIVEDLMGIHVRADLHKVNLAPQLPADWSFAELQGLSFGDHTITVHVTKTGVTVTHISGVVSLSVTTTNMEGDELTFILAPGETKQMSY